jgi:Caspase domain
MNQLNQLNGKPWAQNRTNFDRNLAVVIGIDLYENHPNIHNLSTPVIDANAFADLLETEYEYKPENVQRLINEKATLKELRTLLNNTLLDRLQPKDSDRLIFYFAGHGLPKNSDKGPTGYLVPYDAKLGQESSFLPMSEVYEALNKLHCHHLLVVLDCCFAGTFRWANSRKLIAELETIRREHYDRFIRFPAWQVSRQG